MSPGAAPIINVCVNRTGSTEGLRMSSLHNNQRRSEPWSSLRHRRSFRATQCAGIGSVSLLGRARDPLGRKLHNYGSVVNACVGARHNLPRSNNTVSLSCYDSKVGSGRTAIVPPGLVNALIEGSEKSVVLLCLAVHIATQ